MKRKNNEEDESGPSCNCGIEAQARTVKKAGKNYGKKFWGCSFFPDGCKFFMWKGSDYTSKPKPVAVRKIERQATNIGNVPFDVLLWMFSYLSLRDIVLSVKRTCKSWYLLSKNSNLLILKSLKIPEECCDWHKPILSLMNISPEMKLLMNAIGEDGDMINRTISRTLSPNQAKLCLDGFIVEKKRVVWNEDGGWVEEFIRLDKQYSNFGENYMMMLVYIFEEDVSFNGKKSEKTCWVSVHYQLLDLDKYDFNEISSSKEMMMIVLSRDSKQKKGDFLTLSKAFQHLENLESFKTKKFEAVMDLLKEIQV
jgi:hypothetical protein